MKKNIILIFVACIALNFAACRDTKNTETLIEEVTPEVEEMDEMEVDTLSIDMDEQDIELEDNNEE